jgi:hypothetical protein
MGEKFVQISQTDLLNFKSFKQLLKLSFFGTANHACLIHAFT